MSILYIRDADGNFVPVPYLAGKDNVFVATYGQTTHAEILAAYNAGKVCYCSYAGLFGLAVKVNANNARFVSTANNYLQAILSVNSSNEWSYSTSDLRLAGLTPNTVVVADASGMSASSELTVDSLATKKLVEDLIGAADTLLGTGEVTV